MANEELIALLNNLQGSGAGRILGPGLLAQLPPLVDAGIAAGATAEGTAKALGSLKTAAAAKVATGARLTESVAKSALGTVGGGLTLLPIVSGLLKLFGVGGKKEEPPPLEKFALPPSIQAEAGLSASGETFLIDRGIGDRIRQLPATVRSTQAGGGSGWAGAGTAPGGAGASITVNVQAMDSQSFLDRREDIARAVREAMLQSHSLNDVVSEL
jgi:hypothetical protein